MSQVAEMGKQILVTVHQTCEETLKNNKYHKIFNLNTLKLTYCCITSIGNISKQHNSKVLSKTNDNNNRKCNCRLKPNCSLKDECLTQCLVCKATSTTSNNIDELLKGHSKHGVTTV